MIDLSITKIDKLYAWKTKQFTELMKTYADPEIKDSLVECVQELVNELETACGLLDE